MFTSLSTTSALSSTTSKVLCLAIHGAGKTTQAKRYLESYGPGFIISGEGGLRSIADVDIPFLPFQSFDGVHDPSTGYFSYKGIKEMICSQDFADQGFKWIMLDSLTELSDQLHAHLRNEAASGNRKYLGRNGEENGLAIWGDYGNMLIDELKFIRDLPYHVIVTCLVKEEVDDNLNKTYWPMVKGAQVARQIPGIFDFVFGLVKQTEGQAPNVSTNRFIITDEVYGWKGKARDPHGRLAPVEQTANIPDLIRRCDMNDEEYAHWQKAMQDLAAAQVAASTTTDTQQV